jgi:hypothetical protein
MEDRPSRRRSPIQDHQEENQSTCGLQIGLKASGVMCMGFCVLAFIVDRLVRVWISRPKNEYIDTAV